MKTFEKELERFSPVIRRLSNLSLLFKKVVVKGEENFVKEGPNIIIGNHIGTFKDIAVLFKYVPRPIFFTANKMIFDKDELNSLVQKHLKRNLKDFGMVLDRLINPVKMALIKYISRNISKIGTIPVDLDAKKRLAFYNCQQYLRTQKAIIALQGRGRVMLDLPNPYVFPFRRGASILSYNLHKEGISVPVTPIAIYGTQIPLFIPGVVKLNIGKPMYIMDYLSNEATETINRFKDVLEQRVRMLFKELIQN
ncbi:MAG: lysophospholipid acyltransferase family protein [Candidatus Aminicenantaceae bacterium]